MTIAIEGLNRSGLGGGGIVRMKCRDFLWEYDFMAHLAPRADLSYEEILTYALASYIASHDLDDGARNALVAQWKPLARQVVAACRAEPAAEYWSGVFEATLTKAMGEHAGPQPTASP